MTGRHSARTTVPASSTPGSPGKRSGGGRGLPSSNGSSSDHSGSVRAEQNQPRARAFIIELPASKGMNTIVECGLRMRNEIRTGNPQPQLHGGSFVDTASAVLIGRCPCISFQFFGYLGPSGDPSRSPRTILTEEGRHA